MKNVIINKKLLLAIIFFFSILTHQAQHKAKHKLNRSGVVYISIKQYKRIYNKVLTKSDSLNFKFRNNDTLVKVQNYKVPKGISVPYEYKDSTFLELYKKIAFNPIHKDSTNSKPMKYWKDGIKIFF